MKLSGYRLVLTPEAGPVQSPGLPFLRFAQRMEKATHLWHTQRDALLRFFFLLVGLPPQHHQRGVGHQRERHIAVPGMPGAHFILIESHLPFGLFVALFDLEAPAGHTHQLGKRRLGWTRSPKVGLACS